jgi:hypothetical protein
MLFTYYVNTAPIPILSNVTYDKTRCSLAPTLLENSQGPHGAATRPRFTLEVPDMTATSLPPIPIAFAVLLAGHGLRKGSLSVSGALAAFVVGSTMCAVQLRTFAVSLIGFYLLGSRATKVGKHVKRKLEEGYEVGAKRNAFQVVCNSATAFVASIMWSAAFVDGERDVFAAIMAVLAEFCGSPDREVNYDSVAWCAIDLSVGGGWSRYLLYLTLG